MGDGRGRDLDASCAWGHGRDPVAARGSDLDPTAVRVRLLDTAAGRFVAEATARGIVRIDGVGPEVTVRNDDDDTGRSDAAAEHLARLADQLDDYLAGTGRGIDVPLDLDAAGVHDEFAREVYLEICHIPYGETST